MARILVPLSIGLLATALPGCSGSHPRAGDGGPDSGELARDAGPGTLDAGPDSGRDGSPGCPPDTTPCGELCVDTRSDTAHCGGCFSACTAGQVCVGGACCTREPVEALDLLLVIDNSNSMAEEQASFAEQLPRIMRVLATGDLDFDGTRDFEPPSSLHVGVISTDMGTGGFAVPSCAEPNFGDDGILRTEGNTALPGCMAVYPPFLEFTPGGSADPEAFASDADCVARMGTGGCGFEQQLEAVLKAVTPSTSEIVFGMGTRGHADGANAGFLRRDALLAVVVLTDEDDCSVADPELFNPSSTIYGGNLNLRCFTYPMAIHPIERYVEGLIAVKEDPSLVSFNLIAGIPPDLVESGAADYEAILADERMQERVDPDDPNRLVPSCNVLERGVAFPPRRMVRLAEQLEGEGAAVSLGSICQADFTPAVNAMLDALARAEPVRTTCEP